MAGNLGVGYPLSFLNRRKIDWEKMVSCKSKSRQIPRAIYIQGSLPGTFAKSNLCGSCTKNTLDSGPKSSILLNCARGVLAIIGEYILLGSMTIWKFV